MDTALLKYEIKKYIKSNKYIAPFIALLSYLAAAYSIAPFGVLSSFSLSSIWIFLIMVWIGFTYNDTKEATINQVIYLKLKKKRKLWLSKILLMFIVSFLFSFVAVLYPIANNTLHGFGLYKRALEPIDVITAFLVHLIYACIAGVVGLFFNDRIIKNKKAASALVILASLITVVRGALERDVSIAKAVTWIFPPIYSFSEIFGKMEYVILGNLIVPFLYLVVYLMILSVIYIKLMKFRLFQ